MPTLIVTSVAAEAEAIGSHAGTRVVTSGVGRTNAAAATTEAILRHGPFDCVLSAGVAGALPGGGLAIGGVVVASSCLYVEEGLFTPGGFTDITALGLALGDFAGNVVPVDGRLLALLQERFAVGPIATVATCSGSDPAAKEVVPSCMRRGGSAWGGSSCGRSAIPRATVTGNSGIWPVPWPHCPGRWPGRSTRSARSLRHRSCAADSIPGRSR